MFSIITEITRRNFFRYASNDCVCEFISEPWEWLHEASSRVSDRIYICNRKKKREDKISLYLRAYLSPRISTFKLWHTATNYTKLCNMTEPKVSVNGK